MTCDLGLCGYAGVMGENSFLIISFPVARSCLVLSSLPKGVWIGVSEWKDRTKNTHPEKVLFSPNSNPFPNPVGFQWSSWYPKNSFN